MAHRESLGAPVCTLPVSGATPKAPSDALRWSHDGQALVVAGDALHVITPAAGIALSDASQVALCLAGQPSERTAVSLAHFVCTVSAPAPAEAYDYAVDALDALGGDWVAAAWSPPGLGARNTCCIAAITAQRSVVLIDAPRDHIKGPWVIRETLAAPEVLRRSNCSAVDWSNLCPTRANTSLLAAGSESGIILWAVDADGAASPIHVDLGTRVYAVRWGEWLDGRAPLAVHTRHGMRMLCFAADGSTCGPQTSCTLGFCHASGLQWRSSTLYFATPGTLHAWEPGTGSHSAYSTDSARSAAGIVGEEPCAVLQDWRSVGSACSDAVVAQAPGTHGPAEHQLLWAFAPFNGTIGSLSTCVHAC